MTVHRDRITDELLRSHPGVTFMKRIIFTVCLALSIVNSAFPQQKPKSETPDDVIRVDTSLVQTTVAVFDKQGVFVDGLRPEDFQLKIEGKTQAIQFFSRIAAGTEQERLQVAAARSGKPITPTSAALTDYRGRTIIFFMDDFHLSAKSVQKTRSTITNFVETQMALNDYVAVASATGQIGFLQQFTNNKAVLRAAVSRLNHKPYVVHDTESIPMTEYAALRIDGGDKDSLSYDANELLKANNFSSVGGAAGPPRGGGAVGTSQAVSANRQSSGMSREIAETQVRERARMILKQSTDITTNTLAGLESLLRTAAQQSGRKLVFFVSDGFYLNDRNTGFSAKLKEVTDAAVRAGVVIYSLDARGLISSTDVTSNRADPEGKLSRSNIGEITSSQDALTALASDTGGRAVLNTENLGDGINRAVRETSNYYLLSWRPDTEEQKSGGFKRIEISILNRPDVSVRLPKGYLTNPSPGPIVAMTTATDSAAKTQPEAELRQALTAPLSMHNIPLTVSATFIDTPDNGPIVNAGVQTAATALDYGTDAKQAAVDLAGVILNDQGKTSATFKTRLTVDALPAQFTSQDTGVVYTYKTKLTPGLYQVRAAVRDEKSGKVGSASQWIEIPDLTSKRLTLSSLLLRSTNKAQTPNPAADAQFSVDHKFGRSSQLNFLLFIYNVTGVSAGAVPDITAQVEVFRNGATVVSTGARKLSTQGMTDLARIPYAGQFPLESLPAGNYEIQVTITDRLGKNSATQRLPFQVE